MPSGRIYINSDDVTGKALADLVLHRWYATSFSSLTNFYLKAGLEMEAPTISGSQKNYRGAMTKRGAGSEYTSTSLTAGLVQPNSDFKFGGLKIGDLTVKFNDSGSFDEAKAFIEQITKDIDDNFKMLTSNPLTAAVNIYNMKWSGDNYLNITPAVPQTEQPLVVGDDEGSLPPQTEGAEIGFWASLSNPAKFAIIGAGAFLVWKVAKG